MLAGAFPPASCGGAEKQCLAQSQALVARGHEVIVVTEWLNRRHLRKEIMGGVKILRLGFLLPLYAAASKIHELLGRGGGAFVGGIAADQWSPSCENPRSCWLRWFQWWREGSFLVEVAGAIWTRRLQADVIHVNSTEWIAGFAHWMGEKMRVPVVCKEACGVVLRKSAQRDVPGVLQWEKRRRECAFIAMTPYIRQELEKAGIPGSRIFDVPNGVVLPKMEARPGEVNLAVYGGNFRQGAGFKGFDVLIQAWALAHRQEPGMKLRLYGAGDSRHWQQMAHAAGAEGSIEFPGPVPDLIPAFAAAGYLVLPSRVEGLSNVLLEAQSVGLPAIVSDIPGNCYVVTHGVNGLVIPTGDVPALAEAMLLLYRSPKLRAQLGHGARQTIESHFTIARIAEQLEAVYQQLQPHSVLERPAAGIRRT